MPTTRTLSDFAAARYQSAPPLPRLLARYRPFICPFDGVLSRLPEEASMLDIGCGSGLLLAFALEFRRIRRGIGLDTSEGSIRIARTCAGAGPGHGRLSFEVIHDPAGWPAGPFDVVTLIDVMHHLPAPLQNRAFSEIHSRLRPGGILVYKDMAHRPWLPALANRLHDLVLARQWIRYLPLDQAIEWARTAGFTVQATDRQRLWWYCHEMVVFARPPRD